MANRTPERDWGRLFNFAGNGIVHNELYALILMSALNPTLFEAIATYLFPYGTHSARPTVTDTPLNSFYFETDTETLFQNQANTWVEIASTSGGGGGPAISVNGTPTSDQSLLNFLDTASVTWSNPADGDVEATATGGGVQSGADGCRVRRTTDQSIPNNTFTAISFDAERFDNGGMFDSGTQPTRITIQTAGVYQIWGGVRMETFAATPITLDINLNGSVPIARVNNVGNGSFDHRLFISTLYQLAATDYLTLQVYQNSGSAMACKVEANTSPEFAAQLITT